MTDIKSKMMFNIKELNRNIFFLVFLFKYRKREKIRIWWKAYNKNFMAFCIFDTEENRFWDLICYDEGILFIRSSFNNRRSEWIHSEN